MLEEIKKVAGNDMLIEIQFSAEEPEGGYTLEEGIEFLKKAQKYVDIVQVRAADGDYNHPIPFELNPTPFLELTEKIKKANLDFVVSNVGGWFYPEMAEKAIAEGKLDMVAMAVHGSPTPTTATCSMRIGPMIWCPACAVINVMAGARTTL